MSNDLIAIVVFVANLIFFIWFGSTLTSINQHLRTVADHTERQTRLLGTIVDHAERHTRLLAAIANAVADDSKS